MATERVMILDEQNTKISIDITKTEGWVSLSLNDYDFLIRYIRSLQKEVVKLQERAYVCTREILYGENY